MNLGDMLTILRGEIGDKVGTIVSGQTPSDTLWSDAQLTTYLNWAINRFASRTGMLRDAVSANLSIPLTLGTTVYPIDPSVLRVLSVKLNGAQNSSWELTLMDVDPNVAEAYAGVDIFEPFQPNYPRGWLPDYTQNSIMIWPAYTGYWPYNQSDGTPYPPAMHLRVVRLPLKQLSPLLMVQTTEIPQQYHLDLVAGAAYRALSVADADASSPEAAANFKNIYETAIREARRDVRYRNGLVPTIRVGEMGGW